MLPQRNAVLIAVGRAGTVEDWDTPADVDGDAVWTGDVEAYYSERRATLAEAQTRDVASIAYLIVPGNLDVPDGFKPGDLVTFVDAYGRSSTRRVFEARERKLDVLGAQPTRLDLEAQ